MNKQFDELSKSLAEEGISRKEALRKISLGLAGVLLASVGLERRATAGGGSCISNAGSSSTATSPSTPIRRQISTANRG